MKIREVKGKTVNEKNDKIPRYGNFDKPLSPKASPEKPLTKRQEQNRAAQRAFRERRAMVLKDLDSRISNLEYSFNELDKKVAQIDNVKNSIASMRQTIDNLCMVIDSMNAPTWSVPENEKTSSYTSSSLSSADEAKLQQTRVILGAFRPSSTDPTLTSPPSNQ